MGRGRSPSPRRAPRISQTNDTHQDNNENRERRRSRSRDRDRRARHRRSHSRSPHRRRSRSKSPHRRRSRSKSPHRRRSRSPVARRRSSSPIYDVDREEKKRTNKHVNPQPEIDEKDLAGLDPDEAEMMRTMGFAGFTSTKGKKVEGNDIFAANIITKRKFRQYMNRRGGFNRPLDFIA